MVEASAMACYGSEFIGTFLLVFTTGCNMLTEPEWGVTSSACVLMVAVYALGPVSGGNFNPAVSLALGLSKKLAWKEVGMYILTQLVAGVVAAFAYSALLWETFNLAPARGYVWWEVVIVEVLYTFMLCFVFLNVAYSKAHAENNQFYGLATGFVLVAGGYAAGHISGGAFNPAVAIGIDVSSMATGFGYCLVYTAAEIVGAALAAGMFRVVRPQDFNLYAGGSSLGTKLISEFLGTYFIVLTVGLNVIGGSKAPAWSIAAALMCMTFALGDVSGAHFNPAVTVAIALCGRRRTVRGVEGGRLAAAYVDHAPIEAAAYVGVQIVAAICGAFSYVGIEHGVSFSLTPAEPYGWAEAAAAEIIFTFVLCVVVLSVATTQRTLTEFFGLAIGSCITAGGYAVGHISGGSFNPAISIGICTSQIMHGGFWYNCLIYSIFELIGAGLAAAVFWATHPSQWSKSGGDAIAELTP